MEIYNIEYLIRRHSRTIRALPVDYNLRWSIIASDIFNCSAPFILRINI